MDHVDSDGKPKRQDNFEVKKTDAEWRAQLDDAQYRVLRHQATERPFTSPLNKEYRPGMFSCAGCGTELFEATDKFDSGCGWPSFTQPKDDAVAESVDLSHGMRRVEVHCRRCGGHLGHVFEDGPAPTGLRYCINGVSLTFQPKEGALNPGGKDRR